jgi:2-dehydro-3-deoxyphosphogluconate aldolase / (4S)-4-hydroxy-2-oxoglutarate aldolase
MTNPPTAHRCYPDWFSAGLASRPVMAVFRGLSPAETVDLANAAWDLGATQVEVPIESANAVPSLEAAIAAGRDREMRVGAGTILTPEQLRRAASAGAAYLVSPGLDPNLIALADREGLPILPGVATASEILRAQSMGFEWVKAFPATVLGAAWFTAMKGPFPSMNFVATGGITGYNAADFLAAGASVVGIGGAFGDPTQLDRLVAALDRRDSQQGTALHD